MKIKALAFSLNKMCNLLGKKDNYFCVVYRENVLLFINLKTNLSNHIH